MIRKAAALLLLALPLYGAGYYIESFEQDIYLDASRSARIEEDVTAYFSTPSHGLTRTLQYVFSRDVAVEGKISGITGNDIYDIEDDGTCKYLLFGDPGRYVSGKVDYSYAYDYWAGKDRYSDYDEFYYNIVSPHTDTEIEYAEFRVHFPYPVDADRIWVTAGPYDSVTLLPFELSEDGLTVSGAYSGIPAYTAITIRAEMDNGYFDALSDRELVEYAAAGAIAVLSILIIAITAFQKKREKVIAAVRFEPPEGFTPLDASFVYMDGLFADTAGAALIYLADKGFIDIRKEGKRDFVFTKLREMDGSLPDYMGGFMDLLFMKGSPATTKMLQDSKFGDRMNSVNKAVKKSFRGERSLFTPESSAKGRILMIASSVLLFLISLAACFPSGEIELSLFYCCLLLGGMFSSYSVRKRIFPRVMISAILFIGTLAAFIDQSLILIGASLFAMAAAMIAGNFLQDVGIYSEWGERMKRETMGYREFIDKVEKDRIERLSEADPLFYYHVLPYAMVFDLADKWTDKFRDITLRTPDWYAGDAFVYSSFHNAWKSSYSGMSSSSGSGLRTSKGSSGSAGGGFSGGGFGRW